jgi:flagellar hook-length control protein FliK
MSTSAAPASGSTSNPSAQNTQAASATRNGQNGSKRTTEPGADNSLFAHLLLLLGDASEPPLLSAENGGAAVAEETDLLKAEDVPEDNPLAALAGWPGSPVPAEAALPRAGGATASTPGLEAPGIAQQELQATDDAGTERAIELSQEMAATADPAERAAHETPLNPSATTPHTPPTHKGLTSTAQAQAQALSQFQAGRAVTGATAPAGGPTAAEAGGMVWRHAGSNGAEGVSPTTTAHLASVRSTVTFNERFGQLLGPEPSFGGLREATGRGVGGGQGVSGLGGAASSDIGAGGDAAMAVGAAQGGDLGGTSDHGSDTAGSDQNGQGTEAQGNGVDGDEQTISHWGTQNLRHASLRVGQEGQDAIDIQLSVKGQEVQVDFRTDDANARQTLENSADGTLADLLQRSGIQLAGVSVGAHTASGGEQRHAGPGESGGARPARSGDRVSGEATAPVAPRPAPLRADGSRPLDLFV